MSVVDTMQRWSNSFLRRGDGFTEFWGEFVKNKKRDILFVLGHGFDPRMCNGLKHILDHGGSGARNCIALDYDEGPYSPSQRYTAQVQQNWQTLYDAIEGSGRGKLEKRLVQMQSDNRRVGALNAGRVFQDIKDITSYSDIVVDASAMPRVVIFPLVHKLLRLIEHATSVGIPAPNLHVIVLEDSSLDSRIQDEGLEEDATYITGFGSIDRERTMELPKIWVPILGEGQLDQLTKIREFVNPDEVCPLLPFPSHDPRRGDNLIKEYQRFLFDDLMIEPRNIIYADEQNPFQVYRQIGKTILHYEKSLKALNGCRTVVSALSSKLLSLGALLAVYELRNQKKWVGVAHVEAQGYRIDGDVEQLALSKGELFEMWLSGECYGA